MNLGKAQFQWIELWVLKNIYGFNPNLLLWNEWILWFFGLKSKEWNRIKYDICVVNIDF